MRVRKYASPHEPFVFGSWLRSYRDSPGWASASDDVYYPYQRALVKDLLDRSVCLVADDDGVLTAWCCMERQQHTLALHYVFCKRAWRGEGLARVLLSGCMAELGQSDADDLVYTHLALPCSRWFDASGWRYVPRFLGRKGE